MNAYLDRKKNGLCTQCGLNPLVTKTLCQECREKKKTAAREWFASLSEQGLCWRCAAKPCVSKRFCQECLDFRNSKHRDLKIKVYNAYGGVVCACCGETEEAFLSIDHINNDGYKLRKQGQGVGERLYRWLIKNNFPEGYQILCHNCQWGKRTYGICPHQTRRSSRQTIPTEKH